LSKFVPILEKSQGFLYEKSVSKNKPSLEVLCRVKIAKSPAHCCLQSFATTSIHENLANKECKLVQVALQYFSGDYHCYEKSEIFFIKRLHNKSRGSLPFTRIFAYHNSLIN